MRLVVNDDEAGEQSVDGPDARDEREVRVDDVRLKNGEQKLVGSVDPKDGVAEADEGDNERKAPVRRTSGERGRPAATFESDRSASSRAGEVRLDVLIWT